MFIPSVHHVPLSNAPKIILYLPKRKLNKTGLYSLKNVTGETEIEVALRENLSMLTENDPSEDRLCSCATRGGAHLLSPQRPVPEGFISLAVQAESQPALKSCLHLLMLQLPQDYFAQKSKSNTKYPTRQFATYWRFLSDEKLLCLAGVQPGF